MKCSILFSDGSIVTYRGRRADIQAQSFVDSWNLCHERAKCSIVVEGVDAGSPERGPVATPSFLKQNVTSV